MAEFTTQSVHYRDFKKKLRGKSIVSRKIQQIFFVLILKKYSVKE